MQNGRMFVVVFVSLVAACAFAQSETSSSKSGAQGMPAGPTKVTGTPTKTASGLEYWDIKAGTGPVWPQSPGALYGLANQWQEIRQFGRRKAF